MPRLGEVAHSARDLADEKAVGSFVQLVPEVVHPGKEHSAGLPIEPIDVEIDGSFLRGISAPQHQKSNRQHGEEQKLSLVYGMSRVIGLVAATSRRQHAIEPVRVAPQEDAKKRGDRHRDKHVDGRLLGTKSGIMREKGEVRHLDPCVLDYPCGGEEEEEPQQVMSSRGGLVHDHGLADESAEKRKGRNGSGPDDAKPARPRHGTEKSTQFGSPDFAGPVENRAHAHEEQPLVDDVSKYVGDGAVDGQRGTDSDAYHHKADLIDLAVAKHPSQVILDDRKEDREHGHACSNHHEDLGPRKRRASMQTAAFVVKAHNQTGPVTVASA